MTKLLRKVVAEIEKLPPDEQDAIALRLQAELEAERDWKTRFEQTPDDQWGRLAQLVRQDIADGKTVALDDIFPISLSRNEIKRNEVLDEK